MVRLVLRLPGARPCARRLVRFAIQHVPLDKKTQQRLYGLFASEVVPSHDVACTVRVARGLDVRLALRLDDWVNSQLYYWGYNSYERGVTNLMRRLLPSCRSIYDVGANVGYYTVLAAALAPNAEVHAFEPWPLLFARLERNVALNSFRRVHLNQLAISDRDGVASLHLPASSAGDHHLTNASLVPGFIAQEAAIQVPVARLDTYSLGRGIGHVDLVKIDVEGAELSVLEGMGELFYRWQPDVIIEVLDMYAEDLDRFFSAGPYRKFLITNTGLEEVTRLEGHPSLRDYYLSVAPKREGLGASLGMASARHLWREKGC